MLDQRAFEISMASLEKLLVEQLGLHEELLTLMQDKRRAIKSGNPTQLTMICQLEHEKVQLISEMEKQRLELIGRMTQMIEPNATKPKRLVELAAIMPQEQRDRVVLLREQLRGKMKAVQQEASVARRATESLVKHMQSLIQTVTAVSTGISVYGSKGSINTERARISTLNMTA
ncbi:flagellar protein FlgN [Poriferisphaera sp. WC338]|uniref:flagellar protein FlgN n=1 Tax=Poriferisphaera sp. WC338 TaxID=3425129 RepID=UPI003D813331